MLRTCTRLCADVHTSARMHPLSGGAIAPRQSAHDLSPLPARAYAHVRRWGRRAGALQWPSGSKLTCPWVPVQAGCGFFRLDSRAELRATARAAADTRRMLHHAPLHLRLGALLAGGVCALLRHVQRALANIRADVRWGILRALVCLRAPPPGLLNDARTL